MSLEVTQPGVLALLQDSGRIGHHRIGLTTGGPLDRLAFDYCNRLLGNPLGATCIEVSFGGLELEAAVDTFICLTGADMPLTINGVTHSAWEVHPLRAGQTVTLGYAGRGCRAYLGVADGFQVDAEFGSSATVVREKLGGLNGDRLQPGDQLPCSETAARPLRYLPSQSQPRYHDRITVRVIPGYQESAFSRLEQRRFFSQRFTVTDRCDRMGYRLEGPVIQCELDGILSEGICHGAIQIPSDGQPIVLLNDRQTIGGYPKIGSALSLDTMRLAQLRPGGEVSFAPISVHEAHNILHLAHSFHQRQPLLERLP